MRPQPETSAASCAAPQVRLGELRIGEVSLPRVDKLMAGSKRSVLGHAAVGGTIGFCVPDRKLALAVTVSKLTGQKVGVKKLVELMMSEVGLGAPTGL